MSWERFPALLSPRRIACLLLALVITACAQPTPAVSTPTEFPQTPATNLPTISTAVEQTPTAIGTAPATPAKPAAKSSSTATVRSVIIYPTPTITPTPSVQVNDAADSPDDKWTATFYACDGGGCAPHIQVVNKTGSHNIWTYVGEASAASEVEYQFYQWSKDGKYLYFAKVSLPAIPFVLYYSGAYDLLKLDLATGAVTSLLPPINRGSTVSFDPARLYSNPEAFTLSPSETKIAYTLMAGNGYHSTRTLIVRDLMTQVDMPVAVYTDTYFGLGGYVWSPEETSIVYALATFTETPISTLPDRISLIRLDLNDLTFHTLVKDDKRWLLPEKWDQDNKIEVYDPFIRPDYWLLDPISGKLNRVKVAAPATATPTRNPNGIPGV